MSKINLLPWREERRKELQSQFMALGGVVTLFAGIIWGVVHFYYVQKIDFQNERIALIDEQIVIVDKKIEEIHKRPKQEEPKLIEDKKEEKNKETNDQT